MDNKCTIIIANNSNKKSILKKVSKDRKLYNIKFYSFNELKRKLFFDYDNKTLEYVIKNYNVSLSVAKIYLENLYFLKNIDDEKISFLNGLKSDLESKQLFIYDEYFNNYVKDKRVIVYGFSNITKEEQLILNKLNTTIEYKNEENNAFVPKVYEAKTMEQEVEFVAIQISELLNQGIMIDKIKIIASEDYNNTLNRYFNWYHIPINLKLNNSYYSTFIVQEFLEQYDDYTISENVAILSEKYQDINDLITIINRSVLVQDKDIRKDFIIQDLKNTYIKGNTYDKAIEVCSFKDYFDDDAIVFWLGFNINFYPKVYKDDEYLNDDVKRKLGIDTSIDKNKYQKLEIKNKVASIQSLTISYKLSSSKGVFYPSFLIQDLELEVLPVTFNREISYSLINSNLLYAKDLDNLYKFNIISNDLGLYRNSLNIDYREYNNEFKGINKEKLISRIGSEFTLAYTNMEMYNECAFKYYLSKILKIDIFEESFKTIIGTIVHHILELGLSKEIDINVEIMDFIKDKGYELNRREYFYLEKLSEELKLVLDIIKKQASHSKLNRYLFETELEVYKDRENVNITFKGLIDKVMFKEENGEEILAVVDYKTGNTIITLEDLEYGLYMQLPIYLYLLKKSERFKNATIAGFYIQKVLDQVPIIQDKKTLYEIREEQLKLQGYSNSALNILELLDDDYLSGKMIKGLRFKNDGSLYAGAKVLSSKEMDDLTLVVDTKIEECIEAILNGKFAINPKVIKGKNISCEYCKFKDVCFKEKKNEVILGGETDEMDRGTDSCD